MSSRRLDRLVLGQLTPLVSVDSMTIISPKDHKLINEFTAWFLPSFRYSSPHLKVYYKHLNRTDQIPKVIIHSGGKVPVQHQLTLSAYSTSHQLANEIIQIDRPFTDTQQQHRR
eukprot:GHVQ01019707.1.p1 GENE.GHVQ01019707.1~~GHVQ01019707.1.p1  ORF type:complete len:114 (-),score=12.12 GHVQ01019707.1:339-680(-)